MIATMTYGVQLMAFDVLVLKNYKLMSSYLKERKKIFEKNSKLPPIIIFILIDYTLHVNRICIELSIVRDHSLKFLHYDVPVVLS